MYEPEQPEPITGSKVLPPRFVTLYRIATQSFPGLIAILMVIDSFSVILPGTTLPAEGSPNGLQDISSGWATAAFWLVLLLASFPAGLAVSGLSFFTLGEPIFRLKLWTIGSRFDRVLVSALGEPTDLATTPPHVWTRTIHELESIVSKSHFRGPRSDDPESVLAAAILLRSLAFLLSVGLFLYRDALWWFQDMSESLVRLAVWLVLVIILCLTSAWAEAYREYSIGITADSICLYPELAGNAGPKLKRAILDIRSRAHARAEKKQ